MKMIKINFLPFFLLFLIILIISTITASFAWLSVEGSKDVILIPGSFKIQTIVNEKEGNSVEGLTPVEGVYEINGLTNEENERAKNILGDAHVLYSSPLIENMSVNINLTAKIPGYMRVKLQDEWIVTRKYINFDRTSTEVIFKDQSTHILYTLADGWLYDNETGYFYYYKMIEEGTDEVIPFIISGESYISKTSSHYIETCEVNISISVQVVQANRYEALWGIESIPQPTV